ncbi:MAG: reverse transcriptase family protein [Planctomycetaceae bacterium]|jgi:RNA-directed DNA polymerase|nr:reverse transcriptase family protein [Planctomycetaceae bacterium]MDG2388959.1 reverse transcriptase family protein [Planctomycetaceae bacterium]
MPLWKFLKQLFFGHSTPTQRPSRSNEQKQIRDGRTKLVPLQNASQKTRLPNAATSNQKPYLFARKEPRTGLWVDLREGGDEQFLSQEGLPNFTTPEELANWLNIKPGQLAWLTHAFEPGQKADSVESSHYHYHWVQKRSGGERLIESPKPLLKQVQRQILHEILNKVPVHQSCHGFTRNRSILTNAKPHCGQRVVIKYDLQNFYPSVRRNRIIAIFRGLGYNREVSIWLGRLTTTAIPSSIPFPQEGPKGLRDYLSAHLPQGAPTSPALANLSAFSLDLRLHGLTKSFAANYTRYADDITISGPDNLMKSLKTLIPLVQQVIREERFVVQNKKRKVIRNNQRQQICGVVVNKHTNYPRKEFDRLKAILFNCVRFGPDSQNHEGVPNFREHLSGRIGFVKQLNHARGQKLESLWKQISW